MWLSLMAQASDLSPIQGFLEQHCIGCHGKDGKTKGDTDLMGWLSPKAPSSEEFYQLQSILDVLAFGEMPPEEVEPPPSDLLKAIQQEFKALQRHRQPPHHQPRNEAGETLRRLNRFQYNNAVVDLLDLKGEVFSLPERILRDHSEYFQPATGKMPTTVKVGCRPLGKSQMIETRLGGVAPFPQDLRAEHGFDTQGDHLSMSPLLMEAFMNLAQSIVSSPDFNQERVGKWPIYFAPPEDPEPDPSVVATRMDRLLQHAFRGNLDEATRNRYRGYVMKLWESGQSLTSSMKAGLAAVLSSPRFLYLYHDNPSSHHNQGEPIAPLELATRLSFFLWGSLPDEPLIEAAMRGELGSDEGLTRQFDRMMKDRKLKRFCDSFPAQWLQLDRIISSAPNREVFPDFYYLKYRDSMHMVLEPLLLFESVLVENLSIGQFIQSDFTYRSKLLQEAYGELGIGEKPIKGNQEVTVLTFDRYPVNDPRIGGLITNAAVMTMTSGPDHTKPITRGSWLAAVFFNRPPKPPPADVPPLTESQAAEGAPATIRERLRAHREQAQCRGCHEKIDPYGFALENYSPIGTWRERDEQGLPIDVSGTLFGKDTFQDIQGFKSSMMQHRERLAQALCAQLLSFALGRSLVPEDHPAVASMVANTAAKDFPLQSLLLEVILSEPFRSKSAYIKTKTP